MIYKFDVDDDNCSTVLKSSLKMLIISQEVKKYTGCCLEKCIW